MVPVTTRSTLACPHCGARNTHTMPTDACAWFLECLSCGVLLEPKAGDCCVFCSYGDVRCPPRQIGADCCATRASSV